MVVRRVGGGEKRKSETGRLNSRPIRKRAAREVLLAALSF